MAEIEEIDAKVSKVAIASIASIEAIEAISSKKAKLCGGTRIDFWRVHRHESTARLQQWQQSTTCPLLQDRKLKHNS